MGLNGGWVYRDRVGPRWAGQTVVAYYAQRYRHSTADQWRDRAIAGQIYVDGQAAAPDQVLGCGQTLTYHRPPWHEPAVPLEFEVVYEDADLAVVAKPSGLPVMPGGGFLDHTLLGQLQRRYPTETPIPIHRLGRGTSGLVLLARTSLARSRLTAQLRDRTMTKIYRAIAAGPTASQLRDHFTVTQPIGKIFHSTLGYVYGSTDDGAFAQSDCQVLERDRDRLLLDVTILTGRPHQIRIHLAAVGIPLEGDPLYAIGGQPRSPDDPDSSVDPRMEQIIGGGGDAIARPGDCGYRLCAHTLGFDHPRTGDRLTVHRTAPFTFP
ncbi:MAG: pseudouridine synthase [Cyanophyceae cyanobacterium]